MILHYLGHRRGDAPTGIVVFIALNKGYPSQKLRREVIITSAGLTARTVTTGLAPEILQQRRDTKIGRMAIDDRGHAHQLNFVIGCRRKVDQIVPLVPGLCLFALPRRGERIKGTAYRRDSSVEIVSR